ncbi:MAG: wax ester/triacylglycerol synthase family O-acyltransferase [Deltaproteobacteria bacterium]
MTTLFSEDDHLEPLSGLDSMFLYLETPRSPMHVGSLCILDGTLDFDAFREHLASRLHLVKSFRQRLVEVPLGLDKPYWMDDPDFNIDWHLHHTALPKPGDWRQLRRLCARLFARPLDRSRPLWEMVFVEALDEIPQIPPGSVGVISKIHHAAIDGMSGVDIAGVLFDLSKEPRNVPAPMTHAPYAVPSNRDLVKKAAKQLARRPRLLPGLVREGVKATLRARAQKEASPTLPFNAPPTPINAPISADRLWNTALLSLDRVKKLKRIMGCTVNDVVLAICAGGLRRYLAAKDALPKEPLVAMVPVSTRTAAEKNTMGNHVSAMFVQLATDVADPLDRVRRVHETTVAQKTYQGAIDARALMQASELVPFGIAGQAARLYSRTKMSNLHRPVFNCVITNVPGPQVPLYLNGSRLLAQMAMAPILDGMGLIITVTTYDGVMAISSLSSPAVMPDLDDFSRYLRESANELEAAVLPLEEPEDVPAPSNDGKVSDFFVAAQKKVAATPNLELPAHGIFQFTVTGDDVERWVFDLDQTPARIDRGEREDVRCTLQMDTPHFLMMARGELDGTAAFMQGKLKVDGDINAAIEFGKVLAVLAR